MPQRETILPATLFVGLDRGGPIPLYFQLSNTIEQAIHDGTLKAGDRMENEIAFAQRLGVSRPTIRRAIQDLVDRGLIVRRRGIGSQVVHGQVSRRLELTSLFDDLEQAHQHPTTRLIELREVEADASVASALGVATGTAVMCLRRLRLADAQPVAVLTNWLPPDWRPSATELEAFGLYRLLAAQGVTIKVAKQEIGARRATRDEAALLEIGEGEAVLTMTRTAFDNSGRAVEYGRHAYRPDLYTFSTTLVAK